MSWVEVVLPVKQGLKQLGDTVKVYDEGVEVVLPVKQGLKPQLEIFANIANLVEVVLPVKQGLKLRIRKLRIRKQIMLKWYFQ